MKEKERTTKQMYEERKKEKCTHTHTHTHSHKHTQKHGLHKKK